MKKLEIEQVLTAMNTAHTEVDSAITFCNELIYYFPRHKEAIEGWFKEIFGTDLVEVSQ